MAPELNSDGIFILFFESVLKSDLLTDSPPLNQAVEKFDTIDNKFDAITYAKGKGQLFSFLFFSRVLFKIIITNSFSYLFLCVRTGGAIFRMVKSFVGEEAFREAITRYLKQ